MHPSNTIINKAFPDNQVIVEWDDRKQIYFYYKWTEKQYNSKLK